MALSSMALMCHAEINDGKDHENECLQRDDQNVENGPGRTKHPLQVNREQGDQDEHHFACVHVAEQPQSQ